MKELNAALKKLPDDERQDILQDFEEHFYNGMQEGKTEEEIAAKLGSPQKIAKEMVATYRMEQVEETATAGNILRALWAVLGLGMFNLIFVLGPFIALVSIIFAGWVVAITFTGSPILVLLNVLIYPETFVLYELFFSIGLAGVGLFVGIGMYFATRVLMKGFIRYLKFNMRMVKGGMKHA